jgi:hypothetical protein
MSKSKIASRLDKLDTRCRRTKRCTTTDQAIYEKLDLEMSGYMANTESHCGRQSFGHAFSPALVQSGKNIRAAKLQRQTTIIALTNESDATRRHELTICLEMDKLALAQAWKEQKAMQTHALDLRARNMKVCANRAIIKKE